MFFRLLVFSTLFQIFMQDDILSGTSVKKDATHAGGTI